MKRLPLALTIACASILAHAQSFPYTENWPSGINAAIWNVVSGPAREVLYKNAGNVTDYSVQTQVHCDGTDYAHFLRATLVTTIYGSTYWGAYSVVYNASTQTDDYGNDYCTGSVGIYRNGAVLASTGVSGDSVPLVSQIVGNQITVIVNGVSILSTTDTTYNAGPPGVGWDPSTPTATTTLTALNYGAPPAPTSLAGAAPNYATVNLSWTAPSYFETPSYNVYRNGEFLANVWTTSFQDHDQGTWSYTVKAMNGGGIESASAAQTSVTTPSYQHSPPIPGGVADFAATWGAGPEKIGLFTGALNMRIPLLTLKHRSRGPGLTLFAVFNSGIWTSDGAGDHLNAIDYGYGLGWAFQAGAVYPVFTGGNVLAWYEFQDSGGIIHRLYNTGTGNGNTFASQDSAYVVWDDVSEKMTFRDGTVWTFGQVSVYPNPDAGVRYPTLLADTDGNQITIGYVNVYGGGTWNPSGRIFSITDSVTTYSWFYNNSNGHVTSVAHGGFYNNSFANAAFTYSSPTTIASPFAGGTSSQMLLTKISFTGGQAPYIFDYSDPNWANNSSLITGELSQITFPTKGVFRYKYQSATFGSGSTATSSREIAFRCMDAMPATTNACQTAPSNPPAANTSALTYTQGTAFNSATTLLDAAQNSKNWTFITSGGWDNGLPSEMATYQGASTATTPMLDVVNTWSTNGTSANPNINPYVSSSITTQTEGTGGSVKSKRDQALDSNGNVTLVSEYGFGSGTYGSLFRTTATTYKTDFPANLNILNRPLTIKVCAGAAGCASPISTKTITYDSTSFLNVAGITAHDSTYGTSFTTRGNPTRVVDNGYLTTINYDIGGSLLSTVDSSGNAIGSAGYATTGQLTTANGGGNSASVSYNPDLTTSSVTGSNSDSVSWSYATYRPTTTTAPDGSQTTYGYSDMDSNGNTGLSWTLPYVKTVTSPMGKITKAFTDGFGRVIQASVKENSTTWITTLTNYAPCSCSSTGKAVATSRPFESADSSGVPGSTPIGGGQPLWTTTTSDALGRPVSVTQPAPATTTLKAGATFGAIQYNYSIENDSVNGTNYLGTQTTITDPSGKSKRYLYDAFGNLQRVDEPSLSNASNLVETARYTYDVLGHMTLVQMGSNGNGTYKQTRTFTYDGSGKLLSSNTPEKGPVTYTYAPTGLLTTKTENTTGNNPAPAITFLSPAAVAVGSPKITLVVNGSGFVANYTGASQVFWNGSPRTTAWISATQLTATINASDLASQSTATVTVTSPGPGGGTSGGSTFTIAGGSGGAYSYYRTITIDHTKVGASDSSSFPMLFSGSYPYLATIANGGNVSNANGYDIIFTTDSGCSSKVAGWEVESYSPTTGAVTMWVNMANLSHTTDTVIYLCYGNSSISSFQGNSTSTWDSSFGGVWHLGTGGTLSPNDSTSNGNNGLLEGSPSAVSGQIFGAGNFNGSQDISLGTLNLLPNGTGTISAWVKLNTGAIGQNNYVIAKGDDNGTVAWGLDLIPGDANTMSTVALLYGAARWVTTSSFAYSLTNWHHIVAVMNSNSTQQIYVDGVLLNNGSLSVSSPTPSLGFYIAKTSRANPYSYYTNGSIDEVRVSTTARSADWVTAEYNNQSSPSSFYSVGGAVGSGPGPTSVSLTPLGGSVGTSVTIAGANFGSTSGTVKFNGVIANPTSWSATSIVVPVPTGATNGNVVVTVGTASSSLPYSVASSSGTNTATKTLTYYYDGNRRLTSISNGGGQVSTFTYDWDPGFQSGNRWGRMVAASSNSGYNWHYSYDIMGRVTVQTLITPDVDVNGYHQVFRSQYNYNSDSNLTSLTMPFGPFPQWDLGNASNIGPYVSYGYDAVGRPASVNAALTDGNGNPTPQTANAGYNAAGQLNSWTENGMNGFSRAYDPNTGWLTNITAPGSTFGLNLNYTYYGNGQVASVTDGVNSGQSVTSYTYDNLNRLSGTVANNWNMAWSYDDFGNRLTQTGSTGVPTSSLTYDTTNYTNQITSSGYAYDPAGNMTAMPGIGMTYDAFDRAATINGVTMKYDAFGRRMQKVSSSTDTRYFYDTSGRLLETWVHRVSDGYVLNNPQYVYLAGQRIGNWTDRTGSKRSDGTTNSHYYPYGEEITGTANDTYKFAQLLRDSDSGLDYAMNRYYASGIGRFLTVDPSDNHSSHRDSSQSWNKYAYVTNDPVNKSDRLGLDEEGVPPDPLFSQCPNGGYIFYGGSNCGAFNNDWGWNIGLGAINIVLPGGDQTLLLRQADLSLAKVAAVDDALKKPDCGTFFDTVLANAAQAAGRANNPAQYNAATLAASVSGLNYDVLGSQSAVPGVQAALATSDAVTAIGSNNVYLGNSFFSADLPSQGALLLHEASHAGSFGFDDVQLALASGWNSNGMNLLSPEARNAASVYYSQKVNQNCAH